MQLYLKKVKLIKTQGFHKSFFMVSGLITNIIPGQNHRRNTKMNNDHSESFQRLNDGSIDYNHYMNIAHCKRSKEIVEMIDGILNLLKRLCQTVRLNKSRASITPVQQCNK